MKISEPMQMQGFWWLANKPDEQFCGTLQIPDSRNMSLELLAQNDSKFSTLEWGPEVKTIHGLTQNGRPVTLWNCILRRPLSLVPNIVFVGEHINNDQTLVFSEITFGCEGLADWLGITGAKVTHDSRQGELTISYKLPQPQSYHIGKDVDLSLVFGAEYPGSGSVHETKVRQTAAIKLELRRPTELDEIRAFLYKIHSFLRFAYDQPASLTSVSVSSPSVTHGTKENKPVQLDVFYPSYPRSEKPPEVDGFAVLLPFAALANNFDKVVEAWLAQYENELGPAKESYIAATSVNHFFGETKFLLLMQGLETLHRRSDDTTIMPAAEFREIQAKLMSVCPEERKAWLEGRIKYANELSLRLRLKALLKPFESCLGGKKQVDKIIREATDLRNYLTHFDKSLENARKPGGELWWLCAKLEVLFKFHLLKRLGYTDAEIQSLPSQHYYIQQKLAHPA